MNPEKFHELRLKIIRILEEEGMECIRLDMTAEVPHTSESLLIRAQMSAMLAPEGKRLSNV